MNFRWRQSAAVALLWVWFSACPSHATVYTYNATGPVAAYPSLPALFGAPFTEGRQYQGILQYLVENPFLCDEVDWNTTSFADPHGSRDPFSDTAESGSEEGALTSSNVTENSAGQKTTTTDPELPPVVLLAARGQCPFHYKAMVAESLGASVEFLIIYNHNVDGEDVLVPMYSEYGTSRLKLLSVTHRTGTALKRYLAETALNDELEPVITMDAMPPEGVMTAQDLQEVLVSTLGLFFMLVSFSGCFLLCAAAAQHGGSRRGGRPSPLWMILMGDPDADPVAVGDPAARAFEGGGRSLLTVEEVEDYLMTPTSHNATTEGATNEETQSQQPMIQPSGSSADEAKPEDSNIADGNTEETLSSSSASQSLTHCAICIDDLDENATEGILKLPCGHAFHNHCIVPWLTERQSKCPLCKYDVFHFVQELAAAEPNRRRRRRSSIFSWWTLSTAGSSGGRFANSWTAVQEDDEEEMDGGAGVELVRSTDSGSMRTGTH